MPLITGRFGLGLRARRRPVRLRLTLIYSSLFLLGGAVLLGLAYGLVASSLGSDWQSAAGSALIKRENPALLFCTPAKLPSAKTSSSAMKECKTQAQKTAQNLAEIAVAQDRTQTLNRLLDYSLSGLGLMVIVSAALGWVVAGRALRPVHAITAAARQASEENLGQRLALAGPDDELKELADTFDAMLARLDAAFTSQRRFVANASHELRTPLTVMRTAIDVTLAKPDRTPAQLEAMAVDVRQAVDRAEAMIEALLTLARSDRGSTAHEALDVAVLAEDVLDAAAAAIRTRQVTVRAALLPGPARGDPVLVERLVTNLIDNAVRYNVPGGWIQVETGTRGGSTYLNVTNSGDIIPAGLVPSLFEPFRRLSEREGTPGGAGLGLSIVRSVAAAHQGQATASPHPGGGLTVAVVLPAV